MNLVAEMLVVVVVTAMAMMVMVPGVGGSVLLKSFSWQDCGTNSSQVRVTAFNMSSPLHVPGDVTVGALDMTLTGPLPPDALLKFQVWSNSSFGPDSPRPIPCVSGQWGSCAYPLRDLLTLSPQSTSVTRQVVTAFTAGGLNLGCPSGTSCPVYIRDVDITIPTMIHNVVMYSLINTNNYFVTLTLLTGDGVTSLGCVKVQMPVIKPCVGWLCPKGIDEVIQIMDG